MRLIDADALLDSLASEGRLGDIVFDIDAAPTVSCEECDHGRPSVYDHSRVHCMSHGESKLLDGFCDRFERRET